MNTPETPEQPPVPGLQAQPAVLRATIHVLRAGTNKIDTYELVGTPAPADPPPKEGA